MTIHGAHTYSFLRYIVFYFGMYGRLLPTGYVALPFGCMRAHPGRLWISEPFCMVIFCIHINKILVIPAILNK